MYFYHKFKKFIKKFFLIDDTPFKVAGGAALGVFLGIIPGEGVISTLLFTTIFRFNRLAAILGVLATNIWTTILMLPLAAEIGAFLFHTNSQLLINDFHNAYQSGWKFLFGKVFFFNLLLPLFSGFIIISGIIAISFYFFLYFLLKYRKIKFR